METRVMGTELPDGVSPEELYDGALPPPPEKVVALKRPLFAEPPSLVPPPSSISPQVSSVSEPKSEYVHLLTAALDVLSARLLSLLAVVAACLMWSYAVWEPNTMRTVAASLFSLTVLTPLIVLYWKAG